MRAVKIKSKAKINLSLEVGPLMANGYHKVQTVMSQVSLHDYIIVQPRVSGIFIKTNQKDVPVGPDNLIWRAAEEFYKRFPLCTGGISVHLVKNIPMGSGMAGGSSDAAATLKALGRHHHIRDHSALLSIARTLGADVPFCFQGGCALASGIGDELSPLPPMPQCYCVIVKPPVFLSSAEMYKEIDGAGQINHKLGEKSEIMAHAIRSRRLEGIAENLYNDFEPIAIKKHPVIGQIKHELTERGALGALMSGSGSSVYGLFRSKKRASKAFRYLADNNSNWQVFCCRIGQ